MFFGHTHVFRSPGRTHIMFLARRQLSIDDDDDNDDDMGRIQPKIAHTKKGIYTCYVSPVWNLLWSPQRR